MKMFLMVAVLGVLFFITATNMFFQKARYKYMTKWERNRQNRFQSPTAWLCYSIAIASVIAYIFISSMITVSTGFSNVGKQQNNLEQQLNSTQSDTSSEDSSQDTSGQ